MNKKKMNKKASYVFNITLALFSIIILISSAYTILSNPSSTLSRSIGTKQYEIINTTFKAEKDIFYLNQLTKYLIKDILKDLNSDGGFITSSSCGKTRGRMKYYNLWNSPTQKCPPPYLESLSEISIQELDAFIFSNTDFLSKFGSYPFADDIPSDFYSVSLADQDETILFIANDKFTLNLSNANTYSYYPSFKIKTPNKIKFSEAIQKANELITTCDSQSLQCLIDFTQENEWIIDGGSLSYLGTGAHTTTLEELKYHTYSIPIPDLTNPEYSLDFALYIDSEIFSSGDPTTHPLAPLDIITFYDSNGDPHTITINSIAEDGTVTLTITSDPLTFTLQQGEEKIIDVTGDNTYDIYIKLNEITENNKANITLTVFDKPDESEIILPFPELPLIPGLALPDDSCHLGQGDGWYISGTSTPSEPQYHKTIYPSNAFIASPRSNPEGAKGRYFDTCKVGLADDSYCGTLDSDGHCNCIGASGTINSQHRNLVSELIDWQEPSFIPQSDPTFPNGVVRLTKYYVPLYSTYCGESEPENCPAADWTSFRTDARMEGSFLFKDGIYYSYRSIPSLPSKYLDLEGNEGATTSTGTTIESGRTIAVNPNPDAPGYIPYGSRVYIFVEPNHWANGWYIAEDTGGHFYCCPKIDIFAGTGLESYNRAGVSKGDVWVYPPIQGTSTCSDLEGSTILS